MLILTNCLTETPDEGSLKVASCLTGAIKARRPEACVVSYERQSALTDVVVKANKLLLNRELLGRVRRERDCVLYLPFPTRSLPNAFRIFLLSWLAPGKVWAVLSMTRAYGPWSRLLLKYSRANVVALSGPSARVYESILGSDRVRYLKAAVDTDRFTPASPEQARRLKEKYGLDPEKKVIFHAGHLKRARNLSQLPPPDPGRQILLLISTFTQADASLRAELERREDVTLVESYQPQVQELFQLSDLYFFPVKEENNCIDVPLSCLEAAACGIPVATTAWGEMQELLGRPGFFSVSDWEAALNHRGESPRQAALSYDWAAAAQRLLEEME